LLIAVLAFIYAGTSRYMAWSIEFTLSRYVLCFQKSRGPASGTEAPVAICGPNDVDVRLSAGAC
jgi:hypothetical protein